MSGKKPVEVVESVKTTTKILSIIVNVFLKMANIGLFFVDFGLFKQTIQFTVKKCPSSLQCWDSNPQSLDHELSPITTRPGL